MNDVQCLIDRQLGICKWIHFWKQQFLLHMNKNVSTERYTLKFLNISDSRLTYDNVLKRLVVREEESFYGLAAAGAEDPPIFACRFAEASGLEHILALANEDGRVAIQVFVTSIYVHCSRLLGLAWYFSD